MVATTKAFSIDADALCRDWRSRVVSEDQWEQKSKPGNDQGESGGYRVTSGPTNAYAKPSKLDQTVPRAAHEKIAADLAHDLQIGLPGVLLHRWVTLPPDCNEPNVALSLIPFLVVHKWAAVKAVPALEAKLKGELADAASALAAFDTWLDNEDRANDGNLLVNKNTDDGKPTCFAYIDYSYSMAKLWRGGKYTNIVPRPIFPTDAKDANVEIISRAISRIREFE